MHTYIHTYRLFECTDLIRFSWHSLYSLRFPILSFFLGSFFCTSPYEIVAISCWYYEIVGGGVEGRLEKKAKEKI